MQDTAGALHGTVYVRDMSNSNTRRPIITEVTINGTFTRTSFRSYSTALSSVIAAKKAGADTAVVVEG